MRFLIRALPVASLLAITAVWGWTFLVVKDAVSGYPTLPFLTLRFALASLLLAPTALGRCPGRTIRVGAVAGVALAAGYLCQTVGLLGTSAANAGLLTGLFVVFTPVINRLVFGARVPPITAMAVVGGLAGTVLLTLGGVGGLHAGDALELLTAVAFALHIVVLGRFARDSRADQLAFVQMITSAAVFGVCSIAASGAHMWLPTPGIWRAILITGALASALAFWVQTLVQQRISAARTALILLAEPAFATAFAVWLGGERFNPVQWLGAAVILASLLLHELALVRAGTAPGGSRQSAPS